MIHYKQKKKSYVSPEIEIMECGEELMQMQTVSTRGHDQPWEPLEAKRALDTDIFPEFDEDDFEDEFEDEFNYQAYKKQMLW